MTNIEKIDKVLDLIIKCEQPPKMNSTQIKEKLRIEISTKELIEILDKLDKDKYVIKEIQGDNIAYYFSSFEGRLFLQTGGYKSLLKSNLIKSRNNRIMTIITITNLIAIIVLTFLNYRATDKANDNKEEILKLNTKIKSLTISNDSLMNKMKIDSLYRK